LPPNDSNNKGSKESDDDGNDEAYEDEAYEDDENDGYDNDDYADDAEDNNGVAATAAAPTTQQEEGGDDEGYGDDFEEVGEGVPAAPATAAATSQEAGEENAYEDAFETDEGDEENYEDDDDVAYESPTDQVEIEEEPAIAPIPTKSSSSSDHVKDTFALGDVVEGRFGRGDAWYAGKITQVYAGSGKVDISYDDGDFESGVKTKYVRKTNSVEGDDRAKHSHSKEQKKSKRGNGNSGPEASPPTAFEEEDVVEEVVDDEGAIVKEEEESTRSRTNSSGGHKSSKKSHRAAAVDQETAAAAAAAAAAAPTAVNSEEAYENALECLSHVHGAMCALGQSPEQIFGALESAASGDSSKHKNSCSSRHRPGFLTLAEFRQGCQALLANQALDMRPVRLREEFAF